MSVTTDTRYALITIALDNHNVDTQSKEEVIQLMCQLLNIIGVPTDSVEKIQLRYVNTIINYYMLDREGRLEVDRRMKQASPLLGMDTRMCIIYRMSEGMNEFAVDKSIHKDILGFMSYCHNDMTQKTHSLYLNHIFIKKGHRRQGLASRLINALQSSFCDPVSLKSPLMHPVNAPLPLIIVKAPMYQDSLQLFFSCGFEVSRVDKGTISLDELVSIQRDVKELVFNDRPADFFFLPNHESLMAHEMSLDRNMKHSLRMIYIMECCYSCKATTTPTELQLCNRCRSVRYCSAECQKKDWGSHRLVCTPTRI
jgi:GNAT superfamily N-acetyltransferase